MFYKEVRLYKPSNSFRKYIRPIAMAIVVTIALLAAGHVFVSYQIQRLLPKLISQLSKGNYSLQYRTITFQYVKPDLLLTGIEMKPVGHTMETGYTVSVDSLYLSIDSFLPLFFSSKNINVGFLKLVHPVVIGKRTTHVPQQQTDTELHQQIAGLQQNAIVFFRSLQVNTCEILNGDFKYFPYPNNEQHFNLENIDLSIHDLTIPKNKYEQIQASIRLELLNPKLKIPDTSLHVSVDRFIWDNQQHYVDVAAFLMEQPQTPKRDSFRIQLDAIRIRNINWPLWLDSGIVRLDTVLAKDGDLYFSSSPGRKASKRSNTSFRRMKFWDAIGDLDIKHFFAKKIHAALVDHLPKQERDYSLLGDTLLINQLSVRPALNTPLRVEDLALSVRGFSDKGEGNKFKTSFSKLRLSKNSIQLDGYLIESTKLNPLGKGSSLYIPQLIMEGLSFQDLFDKKASVQQIDMRSPTLILLLKNKKKQTRFLGFNEIRPYVDVDRLLIRNGSFLIKQPRSSVKAVGISANILAHEALIADQADALFNSFQNVDLQFLDLQLPMHHLILQKGKVDYRNKSLQFADVQLDLSNGQIRADLQDLAIDAVPALRPLETGQLWDFERIDIAKGMINVNAQQQNEKKSSTSTAGIHVDHLRLGNIQFSYADQHMKANALLEEVIADTVEWIDERLSWTKAVTSGRALDLLFPGVKIDSRYFAINSTGESVLDSAFVQIDKPGISADIKARQLISNEDFRRFDPDMLVFDRMVFVRPEINARLFNVKKVKKETSRFLLGSKQLEMEDPVIHISVATVTDPFHVETSGSLISSSDFYWDQVDGSAALSIGQVDLDLSSAIIRSEGRDVFQSGNVQASIQHLLYDPRKHKDLRVDIDRFVINDVDLNVLKRGDTLSWQTKAVDIRLMKNVYLNKDSMLLAAFKLPPIRILPGTFIYRTPRSVFDIYQLNVSTASTFLSWDSLHVLSRTPRDDYFKQFPFEKDYFTIRTGRLQAFDLKPLVNGADTIAYTRKLLIDPLWLKVERDKRIPDDTIQYRPLLAGMLKKIPVPIKIDTLDIRHADIRHQVIDEKTEKEGFIFFTDLHAQMYQLKNIDIINRDSIYLALEAKLMDKGPFQLRYKQSYQQPDQRFSLGIRVGEMDMTELNRLTIPLQSVRLERGRIDHIAIDVQGSDNLAYGKINMDYTDLKLSVMNKENERRTLISMLANLFVRGKNHRVNPILVERLRSKAVFNYWSRISMNGLLTSIGVRKDGKKTRRFFRQLEKNHRVETLF